MWPARFEVRDEAAADLRGVHQVCRRSSSSSVGARLLPAHQLRVVHRGRSASRSRNSVSFSAMPGAHLVARTVRARPSRPPSRSCRPSRVNASAARRAAHHHVDAGAGAGDEPEAALQAASTCPSACAWPRCRAPSRARPPASRLRRSLAGAAAPRGASRTGSGCGSPADSARRTPWPSATALTSGSPRRRRTARAGRTPGARRQRRRSALAEAGDHEARRARRRSGAARSAAREQLVDPLAELPLLGEERRRVRRAQRRRTRHEQDAEARPPAPSPRRGGTRLTRTAIP